MNGCTIYNGAVYGAYYRRSSNRLRRLAHKEKSQGDRGGGARTGTDGHGRARTDTTDTADTTDTTNTPDPPEQNQSTERPLSDAQFTCYQVQTVLVPLRPRVSTKMSRPGRDSAVSRSRHLHVSATLTAAHRVRAPLTRVVRADLGYPGEPIRGGAPDAARGASKRAPGRSQKINLRRPGPLSPGSGVWRSLTASL